MGYVGPMINGPPNSDDGDDGSDLFFEIGSHGRGNFVQKAFYGSWLAKQDYVGTSRYQHV